MFREAGKSKMKKKRQEKIIEIIHKYEVETQEDLARYLNQAGYSVTQATVSRDIRDMSLVKVPGVRVRQRYMTAWAAKKPGKWLLIWP